jgi:predicted transcriptional regulator
MSKSWALVDNYVEQVGRIFTMHDIAEATKVEYSVVTRAIKEMVKIGEVKQVKHKGKVPYYYRYNPQFNRVAWLREGENKRRLERAMRDMEKVSFSDLEIDVRYGYGESQV